MSRSKLLKEINAIVDVETVTPYNIGIVLANIVENLNLSDNEYEAVLEYLRGDDDVKISRKQSSGKTRKNI